MDRFFPTTDYEDFETEDNYHVMPEKDWRYRPEKGIRPLVISGCAGGGKVSGFVVVVVIYIDNLGENAP